MNEHRPPGQAPDLQRPIHSANPANPAYLNEPGDQVDPAAPDGTGNTAVKRRQYLLLGGIAAVILIGTALSLSLSEGGNAERVAPAAKPKTTSILSPGAQVDPRDAWRGQADAQLKAIEQRSRERDQRDSQLQDQGREMLERLNRLEASAGSGLAGLTPLPPPPQSAPALRPNFGPDPVTQGAATLPPPYPTGFPTPDGSTGPATFPPPAPAAPPHSGGRPANAPPLPSGIVSIHLEAPTAAPKGGAPSRNEGNPAGGANSSGETLSVRDTRRYLPSGSFTRALLLGGLDAPTGGQSQRNPQPVLLRLMDHAVLPNHFRGQVRECFVVGAGYGDVSAERAYIRTESLSCVTRQGQAIDVPLKGYVAGEDGKAGMRGRLVSKQGQILANALLAGVASGIGSAFQQGATTLSVSPLGSTGTVATDQQLQAGIGSGVGKALDRLAQYYITLAEKVFPVIEIDAGRTVDVVITQGLALPVTLDGGDPDPDSDLPYLAERSAATRSPDHDDSKP